MSELSRIARLRALLTREAPGVHVGIGDDAAVLDLVAKAGGPASAGSLVWTIDAQVEGTHFRTDWVSWEDVGWRSFMAAASDLAAMGAEPVAALSALVLASGVDDAALDALARGQAAASLVVGAPVVGGNLARGAETSITTTLLGRASHPVLRNAARPGDDVWLAGPVGLAAAGLAMLVQDAHVQDAPNSGIAECLRAWRRPVARMEQGKALAGAAHAAIDISDGLAHDAWQLAEASNVRLVLDGQAILAAAGDALAAGCARLGRDALDLALHGGEDYALLATSRAALPGFVRIGRVEAWTGAEEGAEDAAAGRAARILLTTAGGTVPVPPRGFDHFA